ncbi:MAG: hypothetical protein ACPLTQ_07790 [Anaerolineae bacterium]
MNQQRTASEIRIELEIIQNAFQPGKRGVVVPVGSVFVVSYGHEFADAGGLPEVCLAGEIVRRDPLRKGVPCWAVQLREFPGRVDIQAQRALAAISRNEDDLASLHLSFYVRLYDPVLLLRRTGGRWEKETDMANSNQRINADVKDWLGALLDQDLQIWSGERESVLGRIFRELDEFLGRIGLRVDTTDGGTATSAIIFTRHYPPALYDLAFQFAKAERSLQHLLPKEKTLTQWTGFSEEELRIIVNSEERAGVALFRVLMKASQEVRERVTQWMERSGMADAASYIQTLYKKNYPEREVKLSEQVLLSAIRNPWLTQGEWLKEMSESPETRFQRIERRMRSLQVGR